jgi:hypothetical protein
VAFIEREYGVALQSLEGEEKPLKTQRSSTTKSTARRYIQYEHALLIELRPGSRNSELPR